MLSSRVISFLRHGRPCGGHPSGARRRAEESLSLADARAMDGRVKPGHDVVE
jgi:hypothetical protein